MIAMRYGVVPVARRVGGLVDSDFDANYSDKAFEEVNGFLFDDLSCEGLESALGRAIRLWFKYPEYFRQLRLNGMQMDNSWSGPAGQYLSIFESIKA
jgi:starch synthase